MGCIGPDGDELSSRLRVGLQSHSMKYVSSSFCAHPTDGGDIDGVSMTWLCSHSVAPAPHRSLVAKASGSKGGVWAGGRQQIPGKIPGPDKEYRELESGSM